MTVDEHHPVITAMCVAAYGKGQNYKLKYRKAMLKAFRAAQGYFAPPPGYEHYTPATVAAIRGTTMTHADRQNKTQDEVFAATTGDKP